MKTVILGMLLFLAGVVHANDRVEIKGLKLGITEAEAKKIVGGSLLNHPDFTIAGVPGLSGDNAPVLFTWRDKKLVSFSFRFDPKYFEIMQQAIKGKFPQVGCENSEVSTAMGAKFLQVKCSTSYGDDYIILERFERDISKSVLRVTSRDYMLDVAAKAERAKMKDI